MGNAYNELYELMGSATVIEPSFFIGIISSPMPNLKVRMEGIELDKSDILIDKWLIDRNKSMYTLDTSCSVSHKHEIKSPIQDYLNIGDKVIILRINDKFILLSKVVNI